jgi:glycosyltransferase involved in cell wall biosynthesis
MIFFINSLSAGGAEKVISVLLNKLSQEFNNIHLVCIERNDFYKLNSNIKVTYLTNLRGDESATIKMLYLPYLAYRLSKIIKDYNIMLVQSHLYRANYVNILSRYFGAKHKAQLVTAGRISRYLELGFNGKVNLFLIKNLYKKADLLICKAKGMEADMQQLFNFSNKKVIINNPYDIEKIEKSTKDSINNFIFNNNKKYIISVGRLIALKRNQDLLYAVEDIDTNIELIFLGDGQEKDSLCLLSKQLKIEERVHFLGRVENPFKYIKQCDLFVNCSESEGFPNVLVEAMICGVPVISSDCTSGPREILAPDTDVSYKLINNLEFAKYGILFPIGNIESLRQAIISLMHNVNYSKNYIKESSGRIQDFSVEKIVKEYKKVLLNE